MKKIVLLFLLLAIGIIAFSQEITVRFTGQLNGTSYCRLDSVKVTNLTRNWTETVEYPDTIIVLSGTVGTDLNIAATQGLGQNIPNPFDCETRVELSVSQRENVRMQLLDASGKQYAEYSGSLDAGVHTFDISAAAPQTYVLNAAVGSRSYSIRMVNMGSGCGSSIKYAGISGSITAKLTSANEFQNGDNMRYVGYSTFEGDAEASAAIEHTQTGSEDLTLNFTHCFTTYRTDTQSACDSYTWIDGITYTESTTEPTFTLINAAGCDSIVTLYLTINHPQEELIEIAACNTYQWNNETYTESGDYQQSFIDITGCDSVVTLHLTIKHSSTGIDEQTACDSYEWIDGITYTESTDEPTFTLTNAEGCDSIVTLHLTIKHSSTGIDEQSACDSYEWIDGITYTESTDEPTYPLTNANGCDSIVTLHLTINSNTVVDEQIACGNYTWIDGETYTESTDEPTVTLSNVLGCDSVVTLHLTIACLPTVHTNVATDVTYIGAKLTGYVTTIDGTTVTARGFIYGTNADDLTHIVQSGSGNGNFSEAITDLTYGTTYYYKAYATSSIGTAYGEVVAFTTRCECGGSYNVTDRHGNQYGTVIIGGQCWIKDNLQAYMDANGRYIPHADYVEGSPSHSYTEPYRISTDIGYKYNWPAAQIVCPAGWHLPSRAEWQQLINYIQSKSEYQCDGNSSNIAKSLASKIGWDSSSNTCAVGNTPADNNATGFDARSQEGGSCWFWSSTTVYDNNVYTNEAYCYGLQYNRAVVETRQPFKSQYLYVRCVKDDWELSVTTNSASSISAGCATIYGNVSYNGDATITERGFVYGTSADNLSQNVQSGSGTGDYSTILVNLEGGTTYYYKAYATSSEGTSFGNVKSFTTEDTTIPSVNTESASNISYVRATLIGNVACSGGANITERGFVYGTSANNLSLSVQVGLGEVGEFSANITGLSDNTTYYYKAFATNTEGTAYGVVRSFRTMCYCGGSYKVTDIDGNQYRTVRIGQQCWMAENLRTTKFADSTSIPLGNSTSSTTAYRYNPNNSSSNVSTYGYLYNWTAAMHGASSSSTNPSNVQGVCPNGWHLPSNAEWTQLTNYLSSQSAYQCGGNTTYIAKSLASTTGWTSCSDNCAVGNTPANNNSTGFGALPAGIDRYTSYFGSGAYFWSATDYSTYNTAFCRYFRATSYTVTSSYDYRKDYGFSVRCVRDE